MLQEPKLPSGLREITDLADAWAAELPLHGIRAVGGIFCEKDLSGLEVRGGRMEGCRFSDGSILRAAFFDMCFTDCDFSNCRMTDSYFERCRFQGCKWVGADLSGSMLRHVTAETCTFSLARLDRIECRSVLFRGCDWTETSCTEASLHDFQAENTWFVRTCFFKTPLDGVDFTENELQGLIVSDTLRELHGMTVRPEQAVELISLCGVKVK